MGVCDVKCKRPLFFYLKTTIMEFITIHGPFKSILAKVSEYSKQGYSALKDQATNKYLVKNGSYYSIQLARKAS